MYKNTDAMRLKKHEYFQVSFSASFSASFWRKSVFFGGKVSFWRKSVFFGVFFGRKVSFSASFLAEKCLFRRLFWQKSVFFGVFFGGKVSFSVSFQRKSVFFSVFSAFLLVLIKYWINENGFQNLPSLW